MKRTLLLLLLFLPSFLLNAQTVNPYYLDGKVWVKFKEKPAQLKMISRQRREVSMENYAFYKPLKKKFHVRQTTAPFLGLKRRSPLEQTFMLSFEDATKIDELIEELKKDKLIEYVEKVPILKPTIVPNDPSYSTQWHLEKIGAAAAWNQFSTGGTAVIAIVDDAVDRDHPDLAPNLWVNPGEIPGNGIDDDGNGYIDDVNGWDLGSNDNNPNPPSPSFRHGTHVGGIASAATNNGVGIAGIGFSAKLMCIKATTQANYITHGYQGIIYAADNGADIINCSWGGTSSSVTGQNIINYAVQSGAIVVAAAGNDNTEVKFYPASYEGVVSVAATRDNDLKASFSNYGTSITVSAPGSNIYSTLPGGDYGYLSGTSMASPLVAGLLGLMRSFHPGMPASELINCLKSTSVPIDELNPTYTSKLGVGRIDAAAAMTCVASFLNNTPVANFTANNVSLSAGGSTKFTDMSTYAPTSWQWQFPGGTPATFSGKTPPVITYNSPGIYNVTLTVSNSHGSDVITRSNYISVSPAASCVAVNYPRPPDWVLANYRTNTPGDGWINGVNTYQDKEKAMFFDASTSNVTHLTRVWVGFGRAYSATPSKIVPVRIYDGSTNIPGAQLGVVNLTMGQIMEDIQDGTYSSLEFATPVILPSSKKIFVSVDLTNLEWGAVKDTLSIVSNFNGQTIPSFVWEKLPDNSWHRYGTAGSWALDISLLIHPFLSTAPSVAVITASKTEVCAGETIELSAAGSTYENGLEWALTGGTPGSSENVTPSVLFNTAGVYRVELETTGGGCQLTRTDFVDITVNATPQLSATLSKNPICAGESATITIAGATGYSWSPTAGLSSGTGNSVVASPASTTTYTVTGTLGLCTSSLPIPVEVRPTTTSVSLTASENNIITGTEVTFTATPINGGTNPVFDFRRNGSSVQNSAVPLWSSSALIDGDVVNCWITSNEDCVVIPQVASESIVMEVQVALPVVLVTFSSQLAENGNLIKWEVLEEDNSAYYEVESSPDALFFTTQAKVYAGNKTKLYQHLDRQPFFGITYYRLKMVDQDGSSAHSRIIAQSNNKRYEVLQIAPNPVMNFSSAKVLLNGPEGLAVTINVYNQLGQEVHTLKTKLSAGKTEVFLPVASLNGVYQVTCSNEASQVIGNATMVVSK